MKKITSLLTFMFITAYTQAGTFTCHTDGNWTAGAAVWTIVADADGIPDDDDDIIIPTGRTVSITAGTHVCRDLTIDLGAILNGHGNYSAVMKVHGDYINNGVENNNKATFQFRGAGTSISGSGTFSPFFNWQFMASRSLGASVVVTKQNFMRMYNGITVTNSGSLTFKGPVISYHPNCTMVNIGTLVIDNHEFMLDATKTFINGILDASAVNNIVTLNPIGTVNNNIITPVGGIFHHLNIVHSSGQTSHLTGDVAINGNILLSTGTFNLSAFNIAVQGDIDIASSGFANGNTFSFSGTGAQTVTSSGSSNLFSIKCPVIISGTSSVTSFLDVHVDGNLVIQGSLDLSASPSDLRLTEDLIISGTLTNGSNTVTFEGTINQSVGIAGTCAFENIISSDASGATIFAGTATLGNLLDVQAGTFTVGGGATFTLLSDAVRTASIGPLCGSCGVSGTVAIERFIPAGNADYRDLTSPFSGGVTLAEWDDEIAISCPTCPDGCAYGGGCFVSISTFDDATGLYVPISGTGDNVDNLRGYEAFLGDDLVSFSGTTLRFDGTVNNSSNLTFTVAQNGYSFVGNPYCSTIDLDNLIYGSQVGKFAYIYDPSTGLYEYYDKNSGTSSGSVSSAGLVTSSQGFWMFGGNSGPFARTVTINQNDKVTNSTAFVKASKPAISNNEFKIIAKNIQNGTSCQSNIWLTQGAEFDFDTLDIPAFKGQHQRLNMRPAPQLFLMSSDNEELRRYAFSDNEKLIVTIPLVFNSELGGQFEISASMIDNFYDYECILLKDNYTGQKVNLRAGNYSFSHSGSQKNSDQRFELILSNESMCDILASNTNVESNELGFGMNSTYSSGNLRIELFDVSEQLSSHSKIELLSIQGQLISTYDMTQSESVIRIQNLATGTYIVRVTKEGITRSTKLFVGSF